MIGFGAAIGALMWLVGVAAAEEPVPDCPYLRLALSTPIPSPDREAQDRYRESFAEQLERVGFSVTLPTSQLFGWEAYTQVRQIGGSRLVWSVVFLPMPRVSDGIVHFSALLGLDRGKRVELGSTHYLETFPASKFPLQAVVLAERLGELHLPMAHRLCDELASSLEAEEVQLERIREALHEEIIRVRRARDEQQKRLELDVEP